MSSTRLHQSQSGYCFHQGKCWFQLHQVQCCHYQHQWIWWQLDIHLLEEMVGAVPSVWSTSAEALFSQVCDDCWLHWMQRYLTLFYWVKQCFWPHHEGQLLLKVCLNLYCWMCLWIVPCVKSEAILVLCHLHHWTLGGMSKRICHYWEYQLLHYYHGNS